MFLVHNQSGVHSLLDRIVPLGHVTQDEIAVAAPVASQVFLLGQSPLRSVREYFG